jgi:hypothetical protein
MAGARQGPEDLEGFRDRGYSASMKWRGNGRGPGRGSVRPTQRVGRAPVRTAQARPADYEPYANRSPRDDRTSYSTGPGPAPAFRDWRGFNDDRAAAAGRDYSYSGEKDYDGDYGGGAGGRRMAGGGEAQMGWPASPWPERMRPRSRSPGADEEASWDRRPRPSFGRTVGEDRYTGRPTQRRYSGQQGTSLPTEFTYDSDHEGFRERGYSRNFGQERYNGRSRSRSPSPGQGRYNRQPRPSRVPKNTYDSDHEGFRERGYGPTDGQDRYYRRPTQGRYSGQQGTSLPTEFTYDSDHEGFRERGYSRNFGHERYNGRSTQRRYSAPPRTSRVPKNTYDSDHEGFRERGYGPTDGQDRYYSRPMQGRYSGQQGTSLSTNNPTYDSDHESFRESGYWEASF